jgi:predicted O-methyltransferase YrrM
MSDALPTYVESALADIFAEHNLINIQQHEWEMREFLRLVFDELQPQRTVELGTFKGFTGALLSLVTATETVSVDIEDHSTALAKPYGQHVDLIHGDATSPDCVKLALRLLGGPIDLLFIDDGHYYSDIVKEFELWRPHVRPGGWIVFHDINEKANIGPHGTQPDCVQVPKFWKELDGNKQEIIAGPEHAAWKGVIPHGGLGILRL